MHTAKEVSVALILQASSALAVEALARSMPIWIADHAAHAPVQAALNAASALTAISVTWFPLKEGETPEAAAVRMAFSLDDHHNERAQTDGGYQLLLVFGARFEPAMAADLGELGFRTFEPTEFGFVAAK